MTPSRRPSRPDPLPVFLANSEIIIPGLITIALALVVIVLGLYLARQSAELPRYTVMTVFVVVSALLVGAVSVAGFNTWRYLRRHLEDESRLQASEEELRRQNEYLTALHDLSLAVVNRLDVHQLLESLVGRAAALLGTPHGYVDLAQDDGSALKEIVGTGMFARSTGLLLAPGEGVGGRVWQSGATLAVEDYPAWEGRSASYAGYDFHAIVGVPLKRGNRTTGVLGLAFAEAGRVFSPEQVRILERFAEVASLALDNALLYQAAQAELAERKRADTLRTALYRIAQAASDAQTLDDLFKSVHATIKTIMPADNFYLALYDASADVLSFPYFVDEVDQPVPPQKPGHGLTEYVLRSGQPLFCDKARQIELQASGEADIIGVDSPIWLGVPLLIDKQAIGVMVVQHYRDPGAYSPNDLKVLEFISSEVARAVDRKRAAEALETERNFALQVMNALGQGVTVTGSGGLFEYVNPAYARMVGRSPEQIVQELTPRDLTVEADLPVLAAAHERRKAGGVTSYEVRLQHADGGTVPVLITGSPRWQNDHVIGAVTVVTDLTERKQAETVIQNSERRFRVLAENVPGVIYQCLNDEHYTMLYLNDAVEALTGYPKAEFLENRLSFTELYHPVDANTVQMRAAVNKAVLQRTPFNLIYRIRHSSGDWRWVEEWGTGIFAPGGALQMLEGFISDITERKEAEEALRHSEERFRLLAENAPGVIFQCRIDERYSFIYLNDDIEALTGYSKKEFLENGLSLFDLYHPDDAAKVSPPSKLRPEQILTPYQSAYRLRHRSGDWRWVEEWGTTVVGPAGEPLFIEGFMIDITERQRSEELLERNAREMAALDHMGQAVAGSLDLSTVLQKVIAEITPLLQAEGMAVLLAEGDEHLVFAEASGPGSKGLVGRRIPRLAGAAGAVMATGRSLLFTGDSQDDSLYRDIEQVSKFHTQSLLAVPLSLGGDVIGVMEAVHTRPRAFNTDNQRLLEAASNWAAIAIGNARQHQRIQHRLRESEAMAAISRALNQTLDLPVILQLIVDSAQRVIPATTRSVINLYDEASQSLQPVAAAGRPLGPDDLVFKAGQGISGKVFAEGTLINAGDTSREPAFRPLDGRPDPGSLMSVPVQSGLQRLGTLNIESPALNAFSTDDERLLTNLGVQAALAIQNARLFEALSQEKRQIELLYRLSQSLTTTLDPVEVSHRAIELTTAALGLDLGSVNLVEPGTDRIHIFAMSGYAGEALAEVDQRADMRLGRGLGGQAALQRRPLIAPDLSADPHWIPVFGPDGGARSAVSVPLLVGDSLVGVMTLLSRRLNAFEEKQLPFLIAVASSVALALQNARLFSAERDRVAALTALHDTGLELSAERDLPALLQFIVEQAVRLLGAPMGWFSLSSPEQDSLELIVGYNLPEGYQGIRIKPGEGAAGRAAQSGVPLVVDDYQTWEGRSESFMDGTFRSLAAVPVKWRGQIAGVISVAHTQPGRFSLADTELVSLFADQAAVAIANARQHQQLQRRLQESDAIARISRALNETLDLQRLLTLIVESAHRILPDVQRAVIHLLDQDRQSLRPAAVSGEGEASQPVIMRSGEGVAGQVIAQGVVINVADTRSDPRYLAADRVSRTRSMLVAPVQSGQHRLGTLSVNSYRPHAFSADDERLLGTLGTQAALAIYNAQLFEDTRRQLDELVLLNTVADLVTETASESELIERATRLIQDTYFPISCGAMLLDETGGYIVAHSSYKDGPPGYRIRLGDGVTGRVAATGQPWLVRDVRQEPAYHRVDPSVRSELCVPLKAGNTALGVLNAESDRVDGFSEADYRLFTTLAGQLANAIQKLRYFRDLEQALRQEKSTRAQLVQSEKLAAMGRLVASVAHELNNPLQAIQNALYLIRQEPALSGQALDDLQVAATESDRMAGLISRLRETYRPAVSEEFRFESLNAIVNEVEKLISTHLRHNSIEFRFEPDPHLPYIPGVRDQLKQVLLNLSLNAVEAMPAGGRLIIRTSHDPEQGRVQLEVEDTGQGIPADILQNIFDPFFTTKDSGTGLGLTITYDIIQRHRGRVEIESQPGQGTNFRIWLPTNPPN